MSRDNIAKTQLSQADGKLEYFIFSLFFRLFFSLNSISSIQDGLRVPKQFPSGIYQAIDSLIDNMEVLRRSCKITVNTVTLHTLYDDKILWPKNIFPET